MNVKKSMRNAYYIECAAMAIVNNVCEVHGIDPKLRQEKNDQLFDHAEARIRKLLKDQLK